MGLYYDSELPEVILARNVESFPDPEVATDTKIGDMACGIAADSQGFAYFTWGRILGYWFHPMFTQVEPDTEDQIQVLKRVTFEDLREICQREMERTDMARGGKPERGDVAGGFVLSFEMDSGIARGYGKVVRSGLFVIKVVDPNYEEEDNAEAKAEAVAAGTTEAEATGNVGGATAPAYDLTPASAIAHALATDSAPAPAPATTMAPAVTMAPDSTMAWSFTEYGPYEPTDMAWTFTEDYGPYEPTEEMSADDPEDVVVYTGQRSWGFRQRVLS
ncbi:hypothetical protein BJX70DRAFT_404051 [Aspergillus crustosus]